MDCVHKPRDVLLIFASDWQRGFRLTSHSNHYSDKMNQDQHECCHCAKEKKMSGMLLSFRKRWVALMSTVRIHITARVIRIDGFWLQALCHHCLNGTTTLTARHGPVFGSVGLN